MEIKNVIICGIIAATSACATESAPFAPQTSREERVCHKVFVPKMEEVTVTEQQAVVLLEEVTETEVTYTERQTSFAVNCQATTTVTFHNGLTTTQKVWTGYQELSALQPNQYRTHTLAEGCVPGTQCEVLNFEQEGRVVKVACGETSVTVDTDNNITHQSGFWYDRVRVYEEVTTEIETEVTTEIEVDSFEDVEVQKEVVTLVPRLQYVDQGQEPEGEVVDCILLLAQEAQDRNEINQARRNF